MFSRILKGLALGAIAAGLALAAGRLNFVRDLEARTYDRRLALTARADEARTDIAIIDINESSVRALEPAFGRWPWPRLAHSGVVDFLARSRARAIVYDVLFPEADKLGRYEIGGRFVEGTESDAALVASVRRAGNVILVADAVFEDANAARKPLPGILYQPGEGFDERQSVQPPFPELLAASAGIGHNIAVKDPDLTRWMLPFINVQGVHVPALGLAAALFAERVPPGEVKLDANAGILRIGSMRMPILSDVAASRRVLLDFHGPYARPDGAFTFPVHSFFNVLLSEEQASSGQPPTIDPAEFRDKIVFVGTSGTGLYDVHVTPLGAAPGVYLHATLADNVLSNRFVARAPGRAAIAATVGAGLAAGLIAMLLPVGWAIAGVVALVAALGAWFTRQVGHGVWLPLVLPAAASALALFGGVAWQYFVEGREKRRVKALFGRYVSRDVFDQLMADPASARLGGQRREMTVLFSDIRGFTAATEHRAPEAVVQQLNEYFNAMVGVLFRHQGTLDKFVGDMVMGLFGAPLGDERHADNAVAAALEMVEHLDGLNAGWRAQGLPPVEIGIGINSGEMIAGNIGAEAIMSYTVIGDAVNLGARLESLNKEYGTRILISQATKDHLTIPVRTRLIGEVTVKGRTEPVVVHEVIHVRH